MITFQPIGIIHTPFQSIAGMPIQPVGAAGVRATVEVRPEFSEALQDLQGFSHLILLYYFHRVEGFKLTVTPFLDNQPRGLFATRAPKRPNPIGLSVVKLVNWDPPRLEIENADMLDQTPLLDIKPYVPEFDYVQDVRIGWLAQARARMHQQKSDQRFS